MASIKYHSEFATIANQEKSQVFEIFPSVFKDGRGYFLEAAKQLSEDQFVKQDIPLWFSNLHWVKQINRSSSFGNVVRGCHAQSGMYCQAKLVQALTVKIYDIITDGRPNSETFGVSTVVALDPQLQNQLFVPRGFLHGFVVASNDASKEAIFEYYCDNTYCKESEVGVNPLSLMPNVVQELKSVVHGNEQLELQYKDLFEVFQDVTKLNLSEKDGVAIDYSEWCLKVKKEYRENKKLWYL